MLHHARSEKQHGETATAITAPAISPGVTRDGRELPKEE
jgi:hypothetical protein